MCYLCAHATMCVTQKNAYVIFDICVLLLLVVLVVRRNVETDRTTELVMFCARILGNLARYVFRIIAQDNVPAQDGTLATLAHIS